jgi:hypothetical protein
MRRIRPRRRAASLLDGRPVAIVARRRRCRARSTPRLDVPLVWVGAASADSLRRLDLRGRAVAALSRRPRGPPVAGISLRSWRYARLGLAERAAALQAAGAAGRRARRRRLDRRARSRRWPPACRRGSYAVDSAGADARRRRSRWC